MTIGEKIRKARESKKMTQLELSRKLGYESMQFVSLFERNLSKVPAEVAGKCCKIFGLSPERMLKAYVDQFEKTTYVEILKGFEADVK
jgi:transcriptional regulator with XRE-family HTH domain